MQRDSATYCDEPANTEDFASWKAGFDFATAQADIDRLLAENAFMSELQARIVPIIVEREDFWHRYFYRCAGGDGSTCSLGGLKGGHACATHCCMQLCDFAFQVQ